MKLALGFASLLWLLACSHGTAPAARTPSAPVPAAEPAPSPRDELIARGRYLVSHAAACSECHSPRRSDGSFDDARWLSGIDCFVDAVPEDPEHGCLSTRNLTDHETGLRNRSDREIKAMFLDGVRPDGSALHPFMPYAYFGNMRARDADAIVAYLRTVPGVEHRSAPNQAPFLPPAQPAPRVPADRIPQPRADYLERDAALRGRYLAGEIGTCLDCHTPRSDGKLALERAFQGGLPFKRSALGLAPPYPEVIYSANLTPDATGIGGYDVAGLVRVLKHGQDARGAGVCPPMPAGPLNAFGGLSDRDASDIAHYLLSLAPSSNPIATPCSAPASASVVDTAAALELLRAGTERTNAQPLWLSQLGLYSDIAAKRMIPGLHAFTPAFALWSDGTEKQRWLWLPAGTRVDTRDMEHWRFPVGSVLVKEFAQAGRRLETRVIARTGSAERDYWLGAFLWNADESDARFVPEGARDVLGTQHDVPGVQTCETCHDGEPGRVLGFSAVQQPEVAAEQLLSAPPTVVRPAEPHAAAALGYLHANCAHCHNPQGSAWPDTTLDLRLPLDASDPRATPAYRSAVARPARSQQPAEQRLLIAAGDPDASLLLQRMSARSRGVQMPPLGSELVDPSGIAAVRAWIAGL